MKAPDLAALVVLDDSALIAWRRDARTRLEHHPDVRLQAVYDATTQEIAARASEKWTAQKKQEKPAEGETA
jgi:hypothetical protein